MHAILLRKIDAVHPENIFACQLNLNEQPPSLSYTQTFTFSSVHYTIILSGGISKVRKGLSTELRQSIAKAAGRLSNKDISNTCYEFHTKNGPMLLVPLNPCDATLIEAAARVVNEDQV